MQKFNFPSGCICRAESDRRGCWTCRWRPMPTWGEVPTWGVFGFQAQLPLVGRGGDVSSKRHLVPFQVDVASLVFRHHHLFSLEHYMTRRLMELYHEYTERLRNNAVAGRYLLHIWAPLGCLAGLTARLHSLYEESRSTIGKWQCCSKETMVILLSGRWRSWWWQQQRRNSSSRGKDCNLTRQRFEQSGRRGTRWHRKIVSRFQKLTF